MAIKQKSENNYMVKEKSNTEMHMCTLSSECKVSMAGELP